MVVAEEDRSLVRLRAPGHGRVRNVALRIVRVETRDFPALRIQVTQQLTRYVEHAQPALVIRGVHDLLIPVDPVIVHAVIADPVTRDFLRVLRIVELQHVHPAACALRKFFVRIVIQSLRHARIVVERLVAREHVELVGRLALERPHGVIPAGDLVSASHFHRAFRRTADDVAGATDIDHDDAVGATGLVGNAVMHPDIVDRASRAVGFETTDAPRVRRILDIDHVEASPVVHRVDVVIVNENVVHTAGELVVECRQDLHIARVADVQNDDAVTAIRCTFAAQHADAPVFGYLHVIHGTRVDRHRVDELHIARIRDVVKVGITRSAPAADDGVVSPVGRFPDPQVGRQVSRYPRLTEKFELARHVAFFNAHTFSRDGVS